MGAAKNNLKEFFSGAANFKCALGDAQKKPYVIINSSGRLVKKEEKKQGKCQANLEISCFFSFLLIMSTSWNILVSKNPIAQKYESKIKLIFWKIIWSLFLLWQRPAVRNTRERLPLCINLLFQFLLNQDCNYLILARERHFAIAMKQS